MVTYNALPAQPSASPSPNGMTGVHTSGWKTANSSPMSGRGASASHAHHAEAPNQTPNQAQPQPLIHQAVPSPSGMHGRTAPDPSGNFGIKDEVMESHVELPVGDSTMPLYTTTPSPGSPSSLMTGTEMTPEVQERVNELCLKVFQNVPETDQYYCALCKYVLRFSSRLHALIGLFRIRNQKDGTNVPLIHFPPDGNVFIQHCQTFHTKVYRQTCLGQLDA